jgi:hypothetical protein
VISVTDVTALERGAARGTRRSVVELGQAETSSTPSTPARR